MAFPLSELQLHQLEWSRNFRHFDPLVGRTGEKPSSQYLRNLDIVKHPCLVLAKTTQPECGREQGASLGVPTFPSCRHGVAGPCQMLRVTFWSFCGFQRAPSMSQGKSVYPVRDDYEGKGKANGNDPPRERRAAFHEFVRHPRRSQSLPLPVCAQAWPLACEL